MTTLTSGLSWNSSKKDTLSLLLSPLNADDLKEFVHRCADKLCGRKGPSEEKFCSLGRWNRSQFLEANSLIKEFLAECVVNDYDKQKVEERLSLEDSQFQALMNCLVTRKDELQISILNHFNNGQSQVLRDFDWKLKWVMGSSSLASHQETLLELDMSTVKHTKVPMNSESPMARISVELTREDVLTLISALEKARDSV
ncbi:COMM domain-containing protein 8 [Frankliniella fusca]|uniref:COMM domain-containing protein 8 n=1 Tax=Frankliniella fusca TaxID=407009 RepID=A0AAE1HKX0_9NEOP|nr:COMM domain-containing protein 8 [Frankliniella fusca]